MTYRIATQDEDVTIAEYDDRKLADQALTIVRTTIAMSARPGKRAGWCSGTATA